MNFNVGELWKDESGAIGVIEFIDTNSMVFKMQSGYLFPYTKSGQCMRSGVQLKEKITGLSKQEISKLING